MSLLRFVGTTTALALATVSTGNEIASQQFPLSSLETDCFLSPDCSVRTFAPVDDSGRYYYGLYRVPPGPDLPAYLHEIWDRINRTEAANALVLFERTEHESVVEVARVWQTSPSDDNMLTYSPPEWIETALGDVLHVPRRSTGSGMSQWYFHQFLLRRDDEWTVLNTTSWVPSVIEALPNGYRFGGILEIDWATLSTSTPIWRRGDPQCCPTGGKATLYFKWDAATLVLDRLVHSPDSEPE